ncbi:hypothetical protein [Bradyrhizobium sp.]
MELPEDQQARLAVVGQKIFGRKWKTPLAIAADVSFATIKNWAAGKSAPYLDCRLLDAVERELNRDAQRKVVLCELRTALRERLSKSKAAERVPATNRNTAETESAIETPVQMVRSRRLTIEDLNYLDPQVRAIAAEFLELLSAKPRKPPRRKSVERVLSV